MIRMMICKELGIKGWLRCMGYSAIGFFYSGVTPGASGGQPMQLYYMSRDGYKFSKSCAALTVIAAANKLVIAISGVLLLVFWHGPLSAAFGDRMWWYYLGLIMVIGMVAILILLLLIPGKIEKLVLWFIRGLVKIHIIKKQSHEAANAKIVTFFNGYRDIKEELKTSHKKLVLILIYSFIQRALIVAITYLIYLGFGLSGTSGIHIFLIQLAIYVTVDMLPLPGGQGISEFIYKRVFAEIFVGDLLTASMCISRVTNFYLLLMVSLVVVIVKSIKKIIKERKEA